LLRLQHSISEHKKDFLLSRTCQLVEHRVCEFDLQARLAGIQQHHAAIEAVNGALQMLGGIGQKTVLCCLGLRSDMYDMSMARVMLQSKLTWQEKGESSQVQYLAKYNIYPTTQSCAVCDTMVANHCRTNKVFVKPA